MSIMPYGSLYLGADATGEGGAPSEDVVVQVNYEADLLNRLLALGIIDEAGANKSGELLFAKIKGMHDRAEQQRVLEVLSQLKQSHEFLPVTREQIDYLVDILRLRNWNLHEGEGASLVHEMQLIGKKQAAGQIGEVDAYGIMGEDVRPALEEIWSNPKHSVYKEALELAARLDLVRELRYARVLNQVAGKTSKPALDEDLQQNQATAQKLGQNLGFEKDTYYTLAMFEISEHEFGAIMQGSQEALAKDPKALDKSLEAETILSTENPRLEIAVNELAVKEKRDRWLVGGAFLLGLLYIFSRPQA